MSLVAHPGVIVAVNNFGDTRDGSSAGPLALVIVVLLAIATVLLIRSMNRRLRRLPNSFGDEATETGEDLPQKDDKEDQLP